jgi:hypothetical protein
VIDVINLPRETAGCSCRAGFPTIGARFFFSKSPLFRSICSSQIYAGGGAEPRSKKRSDFAQSAALPPSSSLQLQSIASCRNPCQNLTVTISVRLTSQPVSSLILLCDLMIYARVFGPTVMVNVCFRDFSVFAGSFFVLFDIDCTLLLFHVEHKLYLLVNVCLFYVFGMYCAVALRQFRPSVI